MRRVLLLVPVLLATARDLVVAGDPISAEVVGTAVPTIFEAASPDGRWVVLCQAREDTNGDGRVLVTFGRHGWAGGDRLDAWFIAGAGPGERIDAFVATDRAGRHVAFLRAGRLVLRDTITGTETDLSARGADTRDDHDGLLGHRAAHFAARGERMAYIRLRDATTVAVVRDLRDGSEREIVPGPGVLWRATLDPPGGWLSMELVPAPEAGAAPRWPRDGTNLAPRRCRAPFDAYSTLSERLPEPQRRIARATGGPAIEASLVRPLGSRLVRQEGGALVLDDDAGAVVPFVSDAEAARIVAWDPWREAVVVVRIAGERLGDVELHRAGAAMVRVAHAGPVGADYDRGIPVVFGRLVSLRDYGGGFLDLATGRHHAGHGAFVYADGPHALGEREGKLVVFDVQTGRERIVEGGPDGSRLHHRAGPFVAGNGLVVDVRTGQVGRYDGEALAVATDGRVLVAASVPHHEPITGPLRWVRPTPR